LKNRAVLLCGAQRPLRVGRRFDNGDWLTIAVNHDFTVGAKFTQRPSEIARNLRFGHVYLRHIPDDTAV